MKLSLFSLATLALTTLSPAVNAAPAATNEVVEKRWPGKIEPKVFLISMFTPENVWTSNLNLTHQIPIIGASPIYPNVTCNAKGEICHITTGESEINAAATITALMLAPQFYFGKTYFMVAGIAGMNPYFGTLGTVSFARFAVQVALAYEIDPRQLPSNWTTGYWLYGTAAPGLAATEIYGTEVFELNTNLLARVMNITSGLSLNDSSEAIAYRANYDYAPANLPPTVVQCDVATSDVYFAGSLLAEAFGNITKEFTNGEGNYCSTAQEDNATLEAMIRAAKAGLMDFSRIVVMRTASDIDRAPPNQSALEAFQAAQGGFEPSIANIYIAGLPVVNDIIDNWHTTYYHGIAPQANFTYGADNLHSLTTTKRSISRKRGLMRRGPE